MVLSKQLTIAGSMCYPEDYTEMVDMLQEVDLTPVITHRFPFERFEEALSVAQDANAGAKIMIEVDSNAN